ncbi:hypothetical protein PPROV_000601100 [Pycnococcus provasolii]|uniref:U3 small nucleolar RNA-associated protein 15 C-terminal domain-containing protein n=1 Tax=Pycnococcus provasolii TaxID=41880 RepID=A0A830HNB6_9CHLO|nr:hypothetical protein PPROV_000601100 [Pycnococcus provasolii]
MASGAEYARVGIHVSETQGASKRLRLAGSSRDHPASLAWRAFSAPASSSVRGAPAPVSHIHARPSTGGGNSTRPTFAVTCSTRILVYDAPSNRVLRAFSRGMNDIAHCGTFRPGDGKLLAAGCEDGTVSVFDTTSGSVLRSLKGHKASARCVAFPTEASGGEAGDAAPTTRLVSASDDMTLRVWDVPTGVEERCCTGHGDYVRALTCVVGHTYATGAFDHTVKLWDARAGKCVKTMRCGAPVSCVSAFPGGAQLAAAVGNEVQIWDVLAGKLMSRVIAHRKAVSCVTFAPGAPDGSSPSRMLTAGLDGLLKVYTTDTLEALHTFRHPHALTSVAVSRDLSTLATGGEAGVLALRRREKHSASSTSKAPPTSAPNDGLAEFREALPRAERALTASSHRYFLRGQKSPIPMDVAVIADKPRRAKLAKYDRMLRRFRYAEALDAALETRRAAVVHAVLEELATRGGLAHAVAGRDAASVSRLVIFATRHLHHARYASSMLGVLARVVSEYGAAVGASAELDRALLSARERLRAETQAVQALLRLQGALETVVR